MLLIAHKAQAHFQRAPSPSSLPPGNPSIENYHPRSGFKK
ncbi:Uncharacterized protein ChrSV_4543 [Chromobacterium vaccinii]|nr:Uncharacterized protein ChrSW_4543 [Chromobacterium vaccinii]QND91999.1 Uncharacterized protein ChrSV_4543 [Chromobacterium vaccinii]